MSSCHPWIPGRAGKTGLALGCLMVLSVGSPARSDDPRPAATATASESGAESKTFVGPLEGAPRSARIGLVVGDDAFLAYVCSQDEEFNKTSAMWFKGPIKGGQIEATNGSKILKASISDGKITGQVKNGEKAMAFTAPIANPDGVAAVVRAEDKDSTDEYVLGWIVDEEGTVAGAVGNRRGQNKGTLREGGVLDGLREKAKDKIGDIRGQKVNDPKNPPKGRRGKKISDARRQDFLDRLKARSGSQGNPITAAVMNQVRRFLANQTPQGDVETKTFARMRQMPRAVLQDFVKNYDALPAALRTSIEGPTGKELGTKPLTADIVKGFQGRLQGLPGAKARAGAKGTPRGALRISKIEVQEVNCVNRTQVEADLSRGDEVFAIYAVATGDKNFTVQTGLVTGLTNRDKKKFAEKDRVVFPPANQPNLIANEDVFIAAKLVEDDGGINAVKNLVKGVADVGIIVAAVAIGTITVGTTAVPLAGLIVPAILSTNLLLDAAMAGLKDAQPLGDDTLVVRINGDIEDLDGKKREKFVFKRNERKGPGPFEFELRDIKVRN